MSDIQVTSINGMGAITDLGGGSFSTTGMEANDHMHISEDFVGSAGIVGSGDFEVTQAATPGKKVTVAGGVAYVLNADFSALSLSEQKYWRAKMSGDTDVTITDNISGNPRIDIICIKVDPTATPDGEATNVASLVAVVGTPAASPSAPATPDHHLKLAEVEVANGFTSIVNANITDNRVIASISNRIEEVSFLTGSGTYTVPTGVRALYVEVQGGGGGGGGGAGTASDYCGVGSGGGGGGYCAKLITSLEASYTYAVGAAGSGGSAGANDGTAGGNSTFAGGAISMVANGGGAGQGGTNGNTAYAGERVGGGGASGGDINIAGGSAEYYCRISAGIGWSGTGGRSVLGTGGTGFSSTSGSAGGTGGSGYGGGGGGGGAFSGSANRAGGAGTAGTIIVHEYY